MNILDKFNQHIFCKNNIDRMKTYHHINLLRKENELLLTDNEAYTLCNLLRTVHNVEGHVLEIGCFKGASTKLMAITEQHKMIMAFDTFKGLPPISIKDDYMQFKYGEYFADYKSVQSYLMPFQNLIVYKGIFPNSAPRINSISFVHLDVDLYDGTLNSLEFIYPKMSSNGIILIHDYINSKGVREAVDNFFKDKKEHVIEISDTYCMIIKGVDLRCLNG